MSETADKTVERLEKLAAWQRINAEHAGASWIWEARLRTAEDLERRAANIRARLALDSRLLVVGADQQPTQIFTSATPRVSKGPTADLCKR
jgi:hypothetical protein